MGTVNNANQIPIQWITVTIPTIPSPPHVVINPQFCTEDAIELCEKATKSDGCSCVKCLEFYPMAVSNQEDGTLICDSCRMKW